MTDAPSRTKAGRRARGLVRLEVWLPADVARALDSYANVGGKRLARTSKAVIVAAALREYLDVVDL